MRFVLVKGGPYYGPRGGKWADAAHTIPWEGQHGKVLFHSAPAMSMESIQEQGLQPRKGAGLFEHGSYAAHSQGKVFLSEHFRAAKNWHEKVKSQLEHHHDDESKHEAVMLRVKPRRTQVDEVGDKDVEGSRYIKKEIPPHELEYFDKEHGWRGVSRWEAGRHAVPPSEEHAHHSGREAHELAAERKEAEKSAAESAARAEKERAAEQEKRAAAQKARTDEWAQKTPEERQAKAKELLEKKGIIPGMNQLSRDWQETLGVDAKGQLKKQAPEDPAKPHVGEDGKTQYAIKPHPALGMHAFPLVVERVEGDTVHVSFGGGSTTPVPKASLKLLVRDLHGVVIGKPSANPAINSVLEGDAKFLGKGDDGLAFKSGDQVVKVSTTVPYQPGNAFHKTPERAVEVAREQHETVEAMREAGVPGLMPEKFVEHDGRGYTIRAYAELPEKLTAPQLAKVQDSIEAMHKHGYVLGDEVQVGLADGEPVLFDVGKAHKSDSEHGRERDQDRLRELFEKHGQPYMPRGASLQKQWESKHKQLWLVKKQSPEKRAKAAAEFRSMAAALSKDAPDDLEREIIADELTSALEAIGEKSEKAMTENDLEKAQKLHRRRTFQGMDISVETQAGAYRHWYDKHEGRNGRTKQLYDYGYIRRTRGTDGDHLDVYVGHNERAPFVYVVSQMKGPDFSKVDEQKVMLGFDSRQAAEAAYRAHFNDARFFGGMKAVPIQDFKAYVLDPKNHGRLVRSYVVQRGTPEQELPDFEGVWGLGEESEEQKKKNEERRKRSAQRNSGRYGLHGATGGAPTIRYHITDFPQLQLATNVQKAGKGEQVSGHKYTKRMPDGKGGWMYEYASGNVATDHQAAVSRKTVGLGSAVRDARGRVGHVVNDSVRLTEQHGARETGESEPHMAVHFHDPRTGRVQQAVVKPHEVRPHHTEHPMHADTKAMVAKRQAARGEQYNREHAQHRATTHANPKGVMAQANDRRDVSVAKKLDLSGGPEQYFKVSRLTQKVPVSELAHAGYTGDPDATARDMRNGKRQAPIRVRKEADGKLTVLEGADALAAAKEHGLKHVLVVEDSKAEKDRARIEGARDAVHGRNGTAGLKQLIANGTLEGTVGHHVRVARGYLAKHNAGLKGTVDSMKELAPKGAEVKGRTKTLHSAIGKVVRKPKYKDATGLQDGTGVRVTVNSTSELRATVDKIKKKYEIITEDDYIDTPQSGDAGFGYRGYHLIIKDKDGLAKEIQVRTQNQNEHSVWGHDIYKPQTEKQKEGVARHEKELAAYARAVSDYFFAKDNGKEAEKPPCIEAAELYFRCI